MDDRPAVSFIVPSYRSRKTIGATLEAIAQQRTPLGFEVLVVDSSEDGSGAWIVEAHPEARLITARRRLFPGAARNLGARHAKGDLLAFIDADAAPAPDWLETMRSALLRGAALAGGWVANANPDTGASRILHWIEFSETLPGSPPGPRSALSSSNWLIPRSDFLATGGFSETAAMSEDLLFCRGFHGTIRFEAGSGVFHWHREDWAEVLAHLGSLGHWSGLYRRRIGSSLVRVPWLSPAAAVWRAARILARTLRADARDGLRCALNMPWLARGLWSWAAGLRRGLRGLPPSEPGA